MRLHTPFAFAAAAVVALSDAITMRVNGWYPCAFSAKTTAATFGANVANATVFECAEMEAPLCYEGVCESDQLLNVFVKRRLAQHEDAASKAVILLEGGPGYATTGLESRVGTLTKLLDDSVDIYLIDHRGTGRSEFLQCDAAQALTRGSPGGTSLSLNELQSCLADLNFQYDGQAAGFSTTSVAMDVYSMINLFMKDQQVYVAGFSYGTYLAQRVLQLDHPQVRGYVFDGVDALSVQGDPIETANSHWNQGLAAPSRRLLEFCYDDDECPVEFQSRETVLEDTLAFMEKLDNEVETNACAKILINGTVFDEPSVRLRIYMNDLVTDVETRADALKMLARAQRCNDQDLQEMQDILTPKKDTEEKDEDEPAVLDELNDESTLLYNVIVFSERWAQPAPTTDERNAYFLNTAFASDDSYDTLQYCVFTGSTEPACEELKDLLPTNRKDTFFYKRDAYFNKPLVLPEHAGALILNGGLDFQTPREFGELLYSKLNGSGQGVMMVNFDYGVHCWGEAVAEQKGTPCYDALIAGLIANDGDVTKINTTCMASLPDTVFH